jgi:2-keto-3-deoxy-L-rhamnonate aldolase RhmA
MSVADLRKAWSQLKATGDAEFATIEDKDQTVKIARTGAIVLIHVEKHDGAESVRVEVPIDVVDALLSGPGDELDVRAALTQLQKRRGDIVRVKDENSTVRIWIDEEVK